MSLRLAEPSEKDVQRAVKDALAMFGFKVWDTSQPFRAAITPGLSDLIAIGHGQVAFIECKSGRGRLSKAQILFRDAVLANGGTYLVFRSQGDVVRWWNGLPKRSAFE